MNIKKIQKILKKLKKFKKDDLNIKETTKFRSKLTKIDKNNIEIMSKNVDILVKNTFCILLKVQEVFKLFRDNEMPNGDNQQESCYCNFENEINFND